MSRWSPRGTAAAHTDAVEVRRDVHKLGSRRVESFNGRFKMMFDVRGIAPTMHLAATQRFALSAVLVYPLTLRGRHECGLDFSLKAA